jgi:hypothetical protein
MSLHYEWLHAPETAVELVAPGEAIEEDGEPQPEGMYCLVLSQDDAVGIEGSAAELRALVRRIERALPPEEPGDA